MEYIAMLYILSGLQRGDHQGSFGVMEAVKKEFTRRRLEYTESNDVKATIRRCASHDDPLLIPTPLNSLLLPIVEECNKQGVQVIAPNSFLNIGERYRYHCVKGDFYGAVAKVLRGLRRGGKDSPALFGVNTNSQEDVLITDAFMAQNAGMTGAVFCNEGSIRDCFDTFFKQRRQFNAVICVNDYVAISLIENMRRLDPTYLENTFIVSFSNTLLSRLYNMPFTSLAPDMDAIGCAVGDIYKLLKRSRGSYQAITIYVNYKVYERQTTHNCFMDERELPHYESRDVFFPTINTFNEATAYHTDPQVAHLPQVEMFLNKLSKVELSILMMVLRGYSNTHISEELFLSGETVRYHLNKMRAILGSATKEQMRESLKDLIAPRQIEEYLQEIR
ncbi:MAG: hypothetical protein E7541_07410 [Ruminococcaceae bacterium]|nr:hypothetical protein [Oscillospiraceae bacterium]